jgi:methylenetetrahydrofolate dehydrogenase (NADP+)/methenyltetrahydrofolate cyclohydrolase
VTDDFVRTAGGAVLMDGARLGDEIIVELRKIIEAAATPPLCLATVIVGNDPAELRYVRLKHRRAEEAGMTSRSVELSPTASQDQVEASVAELAADPAVHGVFVQLPLSDGLDPDPVLDLVPPEKDVDGLSEVSMGRLVRGRAGLAPCTPLGVIRLLARYGVPTAGSRAVIVGRSPLVALPLALLLGRKGTDAIVTIAGAHDPGLVDVCRESDILVSTAGVARVITAAHVRPGAAVIDAGVTRTPDGIVGDVDFDTVQAIAGAIVPMPGGTGPMTVACLLENTLAAARRQGAFPSP